MTPEAIEAQLGAFLSETKNPTAAQIVRRLMKLGVLRLDTPESSSRAVYLVPVDELSWGRVGSSIDAAVFEAVQRQRADLQCRPQSWVPLTVPQASLAATPAHNAPGAAHKATRELPAELEPPYVQLAPAMRAADMGFILQV